MTVWHGNILITIRPVPVPTAGMKMAWGASVTWNSVCAWLYRFGMGVTLSLRSACSDSQEIKAITGKT